MEGEPDPKSPERFTWLPSQTRFCEVHLCIRFFICIIHNIKPTSQHWRLGKKMYVGAPRGCLLGTQLANKLVDSISRFRAHVTNHASIMITKKLTNSLYCFSPPQHRSFLLLLLSRFSCVRLCDPLDGSPADSWDPGILQARIPEWVAISFSRRVP